MTINNFVSGEDQVAKAFKGSYCKLDGATVKMLIVMLKKEIEDSGVKLPICEEEWSSEFQIALREVASAVIMVAERTGTPRGKSMFGSKTVAVPEATLHEVFAERRNLREHQLVAKRVTNKGIDVEEGVVAQIAAMLRRSIEAGGVDGDLQDTPRTFKLALEEMVDAVIVTCRELAVKNGTPVSEATISVAVIRQLEEDERELRAELAEKRAKHKLGRAERRVPFIAILDVDEGGPAATAGIRAGDQVVEFGPIWVDRTGLGAGVGKWLVPPYMEMPVAYGKWSYHDLVDIPHHKRVTGRALQHYIRDRKCWGLNKGPPFPVVVLRRRDDAEAEDAEAEVAVELMLTPKRCHKNLMGLGCTLKRIPHPTDTPGAPGYENFPRNADGTYVRAEQSGNAEPDMVEDPKLVPIKPEEDRSPSPLGAREGQGAHV